MGNENLTSTCAPKRKAPLTQPKPAKKARATVRSDSVEPKFPDVNTLLARMPTLGELSTASKKAKKAKKRSTPKKVACDLAELSGARPFGWRLEIS